MPGDEQKFL